MARRVTVPLTFENGMTEEGHFGSGWCSKLVNWWPMPDGSLRLPPAWRSVWGTVDVGGVHGLGIHAQNLGVKLARQKQKKRVVNTGTVTYFSTSAGELLVAVIHYLGGTGVTITPPSGYVLAKRQDNGTNVGVAVYYYPNAPAGKTSDTFTVSGSTSFEIHFYRFRDLPVAPTVTSAGQSFTSYGASAGLADVPIGALVVFAAAKVGAPSDPTNVEDAANPYGGFGDLEDERIRSGIATGNPGTGVRIKPTDSTTITTCTSWRPQRFRGNAQGEFYTGSSSAWASAIVSFSADAGNEIARFIVTPSHVGGTSGTYQLHAWPLENPNSGGKIGSIFGIPEDSSVVKQHIPGIASGAGAVLFSHPEVLSTLYRWDFAAGDAVAVTGSPSGRALAFHKERFFSGGTKTNPTRLWFSDPLSYTSWPSTNYIEVGQDDGEPIEDLLSTLDGLLIAKRNSIWLLLGDGPSNFTLVKLQGGEALRGRSLIPFPGGAYIAGRTGMWVWRGGIVERVPCPIQTTYEQVVVDAAERTAVFGAWLDGKLYVGAVRPLGWPTGKLVIIVTDGQRWWLESPPGAGGWTGMTTSEGALWLGLEGAEFYNDILMKRGNWDPTPDLERAFSGIVLSSNLAWPREAIVQVPRSSISQPVFPRDAWVRLRWRGALGASDQLIVDLFVDEAWQHRWFVTPQIQAAGYRTEHLGAPDMSDLSGYVSGHGDLQVAFRHAWATGVLKAVTPEIHRAELVFDIEEYRGI